MLFAISSQGNATPVKPLHVVDDSKLLPASQSKQNNSGGQNLTGLFSIQSYQAHAIEQPYKDFHLLYQHALSGQQELERLSDRIALLTNTTTFTSGIKSPQRALDKIKSKLAGKSEQITDIARTSIVAKDIPSLMHAFELMTQQTELVRIKNRFKTPGASGYRDLSLLVRLPESQIIAEIQLHLEAFSEIKNGQEHDNYEQIQYIERMQLTEQRPLTEIELASIDTLREQSKQMYQQAWQGYLSA